MPTAVAKAPEGMFVGSAPAKGPLRVPEHGDRGRYRRGCRCAECRRASCEYNKLLVRRRAYGGDYFQWEDAGPGSAVRAHVEYLYRTLGAGGDSIARAAGVNRRTVWHVLQGEPRQLRARSRKIKRDTAQKLLAVNVEDLGGEVQVYARPTRKLLGELLWFGLQMGEIAEALGKKSGKLQFSRKKITLKNARAVEKLHWAVWRQHPEFRKVCQCPLPAEISREIEREEDPV